MFFARRLALLRLTAMAALVASAILTADAYHPQRTFCPIAKACEVANDSALGRVLGIPTSILGMIAFGGLFVLTLLPVERSRRILRPAGLVAMFAGLGFVAYQAFVLHTWCPLCLVADVAGFVAGVLTLTWPKVPVRLSGQRIDGEPIAWMIGWTGAVTVAVVLPFAWPRPAPPAWVEHASTVELDALLLEEEEEPFPVEARGDDEPTPTTTDRPEHRPADHLPRPSKVPVVALSHPTSTWPGATRSTSRRPVAPRGEPRRPGGESARPQPDAGSAGSPEPPVDAGAAAVREPVPMTEHEPPPIPSEVEDRAPVPRELPVVVEYLNAFCTHCRATHQRFEGVVRTLGRPISRRRVYTWATDDYPLWARACVYAGTLGKEEALFTELMRARSDKPHEVYRAAKRAGLDVYAMQRAMQDPEPPRRLIRDRKVVKAARLEVLPTFDIGRRRLMGEQSQAELKEAILVALRERAGVAADEASPE